MDRLGWLLLFVVLIVAGLLFVYDLCQLLK